ncbi:hypothetical protein DRO02_03040 [archaeon]|nr:MAG: hypothetical protein DRO21_02855 [archaeon]RLG65031.1 MAG: hypothetical protein DRO02_03040 [archaeon]HDM23817.1 4Fe-4S dicluster domain-containing protein [Candidatus Bathyarchaeota archaeon]
MTFKLAIISGKGGVGKTFITASIAHILSTEKKIKIVALDCDVDAPNLSIVLGGKVIHSERLKLSLKSQIDASKCIKCMRCIEYCPYDAIELKEFPQVNQMLCEGCGVCKIVCPVKAVTLELVENGILTISKSKYGFTVVGGRTLTGATASGKIVFEVKKKADEVSAQENVAFQVIDGPPGVGCAFVSTVTDIDLAIVVIEPTPASLHDAKRAINVLEFMGIDYLIVLNKIPEGFDPRKVIDENTLGKVVAEIEFSNIVPNSISMLKPVTALYPDSRISEKIRNVVDKILKIAH